MQLFFVGADRRQPGGVGVAEVVQADVATSTSRDLGL